MAQMDKRKEVVIKLEFPIKLPDRTISEVTMRRPRLKDMIAHNITEQSGAREVSALIGELCDVAPADMEEMDVADFEILQKQLLSFRGNN